MSAASPATPKPLVANEAVKLASNHLRGNLAADLADPSTGAISENSNLLTKFHGLYMQDDRDQRNALKQAGQEKAFAFMIRVRLPGGRLTPRQWLMLDQVAGEIASPSLRLTTRQTFQFHGVRKCNARALIQRLHTVLLDTISACGDVNRNVMAPPNPERDPILQELQAHARVWSEHALPRSRAYHEIWLDEKLVACGEPESEPLYGSTYLPRKFKTGFALPPNNEVDIFSQDLGFIAIVEHGRLAGYNVTAGGGMGMSHGNAETFPRLADVLGFIPADKVIAIGEAVLTTQRDFGDRTNRKHARLKYTIADRGVPWFTQEVERRAGLVLEPPRPFQFNTTEDPHGWHACADGTWFYGLHILSGRIIDLPGWPMKTALRELATVHTGDIRLTPSQNLSFSGVTSAQRPVLEAILAQHGLDQEHEQTGLRRNALSFVALPTCGLALAESERVLPGLLARLEPVLQAAGLANEAISLRLTGCPNGCARPFLGEIGLVGRSPNKYALYLGADATGTRLNQLVLRNATLPEAVDYLTPLINRYALERQFGERFGDFCQRTVGQTDGCSPEAMSNPGPRSHG
jgi:sulfite reductase (NADPH) hemoprotein beta-component